MTVPVHSLPGLRGSESHYHLAAEPDWSKEGHGGLVGVTVTQAQAGSYIWDCCTLASFPAISLQLLPDPHPSLDLGLGRVTEKVCKPRYFRFYERNFHSFCFDLHVVMVPGVSALGQVHCLCWGCRERSDTLLLWMELCLLWDCMTGT